MNDLADERLESACRHFFDTLENLDEKGRREFIVATIAQFAIATMKRRAPATMNDTANNLVTDRIVSEQRLDVTFRLFRDRATSMKDYDRIQMAKHFIALMEQQISRHPSAARLTQAGPDNE